MEQRLVDEINKMTLFDVTIEFTLDNGVRADRIEPETVFIDEYATKKNTTLKDYPKAMKIKELLLNNGYVVESEKIHTYEDNHDDILNLRFRSKEIISKREY